MWVSFDNKYDTSDSIVAKFSNEGLGKPYIFEITIKRDSMDIID